MLLYNVFLCFHRVQQEEGRPNQLFITVIGFMHKNKFPYVKVLECTKGDSRKLIVSIEVWL